jgi:short-subunit dehydrogenase
MQARFRVAVTALPADLSLDAEVSRVAAFMETTDIDVLVNNAGFGTYGDFAGLDARHEHAEMMLNAVAAVDLAHAALPPMLARRSGGIVTVASSIAFQPSPRQAVYGATKAFSLAFSEALWAETRGSGVRIVALCPGPVETGFLASLGDQRATSSVIYRRTTNAANVVQAGLRGFDRDAMTVVPGLRTRFLAEGHRLLPRTIMAKLAGRMLAPARQLGLPGRRVTDYYAHPPASDYVKAATTNDPLAATGGIDGLQPAVFARTTAGQSGPRHPGRTSGLRNRRPDHCIGFERLLDLSQVRQVGLDDGAHLGRRRLGAERPRLLILQHRMGGHRSCWLYRHREGVRQS